MDIQLNDLIIWPDREALQKTMPECFQISFNKGGGVFLAAKCNLCLLEQPTLHGDAEMVWAKLFIDKHKPIYIRMLILQATYVCT